MKTTELNTYHIPELESGTKKGINDTEQLIALQVPHIALHDNPPLTNEDLGPWWLEYHLMYKALWNDVDRKVPGAQLEQEIIEHQQQTDRSLQLLNNELLQIKEKKAVIQSDLDNRQKPAINSLKLFLLRAVTIAIFIIDAVITAPVFQSAGLNLFECFCISGGFALILYFAAHYCEPTVKRGKTIAQRRAIAAAFIVGVILSSSIIAIVRAKYFAAQSNDTTGSGASIYLPLLFLVFSVGAFLVGVAIRHFSFPTPAQCAALREYQALVEALQEHDTHIGRIEQGIQTVKDKNATLQTVNRSIIKFGEDVKLHIVSKAHSGLQQYMRFNIMHRPDQGRPVSFDCTTYPFNFNNSLQTTNNFTQ